MITLNIQVPASRNATAVALLHDGTKILLAGHAAASASPAIAAAHGNPTCDPLRMWGHPPTGTYQILTHSAARKEQAAEYGMHLLLFEPRSGQADNAEPFGRLGLLVYGGPLDRDKRLRPTQGGVRLSNELLSAAAKQLARGRDMALTIEVLQQPPWWKFWKRRVVTPPLSTATLKNLAPPLDEASITEKLMRGVKRKSAYAQSADNTDTRSTSDSRDSSQNSDYSSSGSSSSHEAFQGGGGQSAGAGASGSWDSAAAGARGVDSAGRIVAGVAAGAAAGAALGMLANEAAAHTSPESDSSSTTTQTSY